MFTPKGAFFAIPCPELGKCKRNPCPFTHNPRPAVAGPPLTPGGHVVATPPKSILKTRAPPNEKNTGSPISKYVAVPESKPQPSLKRGAAAIDGESPSSPDRKGEPPRKIQAVGSVRRPVPVPAASTSGTPVVRVNAAHSRVPIKDRQSMVGLLYQTFQDLYAAILPSHPSLAHDHALAQEKEVYDRTNKLTYRNAVITAVASIKRRDPPTSDSHRSVGTDGNLKARAEEEASLSHMTLEVSDISEVVLSLEEMVKWEYVVEVPEVPGGDRPHEEGNEKTCERCKAPFIVSDEPDRQCCRFHWARPKTVKGDGPSRKQKFFACCSSNDSEAGCQIGPHVFRDSSMEELHSRHAFSLTLPAKTCDEDVLPVAALDCEMIYTTAGMSCARVTVVDGQGKKVFDELVRLDEGVKALDYNTRWSGITSLKDAVLNLDAIRDSLSAFIGPSTILIGHALDNDLKTMRMVHHKVVDTVVLFPHPHGPPLRKGLKDLVRQYLGKLIQNAGAEGHSSVEDAQGALDLVKFWVRERRKNKVGGKDTDPTTTAKPSDKEMEVKAEQNGATH